MKTIPIPTDKRFKDLTGKVFGRWTVLSYAGKRKANQTWTCQCSCGLKKVVQSSTLAKNGSCQTCAKREDLTGRRFGRLKVVSCLGIVDYGGTTAVRWLCRCDCGKNTKPFANSLLRGITVSCGCYHREEMKKRQTTHGMTGTPAYKRMHKERRRGREEDLDYGWTFEMQMSLLSLQPCCVICGEQDNLTVDHVRPLSKGHGLKPGNAAVLCGSCNSKKHNKSLDELPNKIVAKLVKAAEVFKKHWAARN